MRFLLAEDERSLSRALVAILQRDGYVVDTAYDGEQALTLLSTGNYDGVVLDIMMPKLDGIQVLKHLRDKGDRTPVLLLTAKSEIDDKVLGLDSGANDYLAKPFSTRELLARVRAMTRGQSASNDSVLQLATFHSTARPFPSPPRPEAFGWLTRNLPCSNCCFATQAIRSHPNAF